jgi:hypothetical protein
LIQDTKRRLALTHHVLSLLPAPLQALETAQRGFGGNENADQEEFDRQSNG